MSIAPLQMAFYRINGRVLYCVGYTEYVTGPNARTIHFEGITPEDYPAYIAQHIIGENQEPYRTVADMEGIPRPELIEIDISSGTKVEWLSKEDALREWQEKRKTTIELTQQIRSTAQLALELGRTHPLEYQIGYLREALGDIIKLCEQPEQGA